MKLLVRNKPPTDVRLSVIMLDWDCRESYHVFDYLADQTIPRDRYEILWIEYYDKVAPEIQQRLDKARREGLPPPVDTWLVMEMPREVYYHKHLMYNLGIALASGQIIVICDSDALAKPTFLASIIRSFEDDPN
ncbi:MAG: glycosyltransferase family 2 protein, partial [Phycisphaerae bacterium]|nr:glycosyltransferase family 2 protein [Phycisphaerae bacterium]